MSNDFVIDKLVCILKKQLDYVSSCSSSFEVRNVAYECIGMLDFVNQLGLFPSGEYSDFYETYINSMLKKMRILEQNENLI